MLMCADRGVSGEAIAEAYDAFEKGHTTSPMAMASLSTQTIQESIKLMLLVRAYQVRASCVASAWARQAAPRARSFACMQAQPPRIPTADAARMPPPQVSGHFAANLDPLGLDVRPVPPLLDPAYYGFKETDLDRE